MALYLYATGAQRQTISVMSHLGISESYQSLTHKERIVIDRRRRRVEHDEEELPQPPSTPSNSPPPFSPLDAAVLSAKMESLRRTKLGTLQELSSSMRNIARGIASTGLFAASYDNINMMFRAAEQVIGRTGNLEPCLPRTMLMSCRFTGKWYMCDDISALAGSGRKHAHCRFECCFQRCTPTFYHRRPSHSS